MKDYPAAVVGHMVWMKDSPAAVKGTCGLDERLPSGCEGDIMGHYG